MRRAACRRSPGRAVVLATVAALALGGCGVPGSGEARTVADDDVPYRLLESEAASPPSGSGLPADARVPVVFWVDGERLEPAATGDSCGADPEALVDRLLGVLAAGPSEDARARGRSSALSTDFGLALVGVDDGTATVDIQPAESLGADQLPIAVGQIVLTVTSAPEVRSVVLTSDGEPVQVPLPQGPLTGEPVTADDYAVLVPVRLRGPATVGCPEP